MGQINNKDFLKGIGMKIRLARVANKVSLDKLNELTGINRTSLGIIENGKVNTHILSLKAIADALDMEVKDFM